MSAATGPTARIHLILKGYAMCSSGQREGGRLAVTTRGVFITLLDDERCKSCATELRRLEDAKWNEKVKL